MVLLTSLGVSPARTAAADMRLSALTRRARASAAFMAGQSYDSHPLNAPRAAAKGGLGLIAHCNPAVPIATLFGQTSPDAPRSPANLGSSTPICSGRLGRACLCAGRRLLHLSGGGGTRAHRLPGAPRGDADFTLAPRTRRL